MKTQKLYVTCISNLNGQFGQLCLQYRLFFMRHSGIWLRWQGAFVRLHTEHDTEECSHIRQTEQ